MTVEQQSVETTSYPITDKSYLQLKLDMQNLHRDIKYFLEGREASIEYDESKNMVVETTKVLGKPLANQEGIQTILSSYRMIVNEHTVQGNIKDENALNEFMKNFHRDLSKAISRNWYKWDIEKNRREFLIDSIIDSTELILTRTIGDGERRSHANNVTRTGGTSTSEKKTGIL